MSIGGFPRCTRSGNVPVIAFFNNKGGVGKTSLVYHLSWMYASLGQAVLVADLDPQANLTTAFLDEGRLEELWPDGAHAETIYGCIEPLLRGVGDVLDRPHVERIDERFSLLVGDLALARFEDELSQQWPLCLDGKERAFRVISAFWRIIQNSAAQTHSELVLIDMGPNLGAVNRAVLVACDYLVIPLAPDLFSLQGLKNLGPVVRTWRKEWQDRRERNPVQDLSLPEGRMKPLGYVVMQHSVRLDRPVKAYERWMARIPNVYAAEVADEEQPVDHKATLDGRSAEADREHPDPNCLGLVKHYRSLMAMSQEARKPMFCLRPADGAIGSHAKAVSDAEENFRQLAVEILKRCQLDLDSEMME